jgi:uncharacterized protein
MWMEQAITYSLRLGADNSGGYYDSISAFADEWEKMARLAVGDLIADFRKERLDRDLPDRAPSVCAFDLLVIGVLLREHGAESRALPGWGKGILHRLVMAQERWPKFEGLFKTLRGMIYKAVSPGSNPKYTQNALDGLISWLDAVGESTQSARIIEWSQFFQEHDITDNAIQCCQKIALDFAGTSQDKLGAYTKSVETFLRTQASTSMFRYDAVLRNRTRLEYHLAMLGTEILNRAYRKDFLACPQKMVIVPPCMRIKPDGECKAVVTPYGEKCAACTPACRVNQVSRLGEKHGFGVFMIPDELRIFGSGGNQRDPIGVVGVSCALTNWSGGWDAERLGIPAQGLLLDYVGCKYHWHKKGVPTDTNFKELLKILGIS